MSEAERSSVVAVAHGNNGYVNGIVFRSLAEKDIDLEEDFMVFFLGINK